MSGGSFMYWALSSAALLLHGLGLTTKKPLESKETSRQSVMGAQDKGAVSQLPPLAACRRDGLPPNSIYGKIAAI